jgi:hypothetical protein
LEEASQFVKKLTVNGTKYKRMLNSGADCSITGMDKIKKENKKEEHKLFKWKGGPLGTIGYHS